MKKYLLAFFLYLIFQGVFFPLFAMESEDPDYVAFMNKVNLCQTKIRGLEQHINIMTDCSEGRLLALKALRQETEKEAQTDLQLKALSDALMSLKERGSVLGDLKYPAFKERKKENDELFGDIRSTYLQILGEFTELQESMKFSPFEDRAQLISELHAAVRGERDAYKMLAEHLVTRQNQTSDSSETSATAPSTRQEQERDKPIDRKAAADSEKDDRADASSSDAHLFALVSLGHGRQLQQGASSPVLKLVGAQYVSPAQPMVAEMFLRFQDQNTKVFLRKYIENPSRYDDLKDLLKSTIGMELALNERFLLILNKVDNDLSVDARLVFEGPKEKAEIDMIQYLIGFYRTFFAHRTSFLRDLFQNFKSPKPQRQLIFLKSDKSDDENKQIKEMVTIFRNLFLLLTDVRENYFRSDVPRDVQLITKMIKDMIKKGYNRTNPGMGTSSYSTWNSFSPETFFEPLGSDFLDPSSLDKEFLSLKDYLNQIQRNLSEMTVIEKAEFRHFFENQ
ncbi:MAG: hypothetical protein JSS34_00725 [Proteobacteria bacterium]|nr:hypothetical protein [Pseudomonadota bacterium]